MPSQATARAAAGASATIVRRPRQPECSAIVWRRRAGSCRHQSAGVHPFFLEGDLDREWGAGDHRGQSEGAQGRPRRPRALSSYCRPSASALAAYEADPTVLELRLELRTALESAVATLIAGTLARS